MNATEATEIKKQYTKYDDAFRSAKKNQDYRKASEMKAKRDILAAKLNEALAVLRNQHSFTPAGGQTGDGEKTKKASK